MAPPESAAGVLTLPQVCQSISRFLPRMWPALVESQWGEGENLEALGKKISKTGIKRPSCRRVPERDPEKAKDHDQRAVMGTSARVEKVGHKWMEPKVVKKWNRSANPSTIIQSASWNLWLWHRRNRKRKRWPSSWNHHWNIGKAIPRALNSRTKNWKEGKPKKRYNPVSTPSRMPGSIVSQLVSPILPPCDRSCLSYLSLPRLVLQLAWHAVTASPSFLLSPVLLVCHLVSRLVSDAVTVCGLDFLLCAVLSPRSHPVSQLGICLRCCLPSGRRDAFVYLSY